MRHKQLYLAALANSFGGSSLRPLRAASLRLIGMSIAAIALGSLLGRTAHTLPLERVAHPELLVCAAAIAVQLTVAVALLIALGLMRAGQQEPFIRLLLTWPLTQRSRWLVYMLPSLVLAALAVAMIAWPLIVILTKLGVSWPLLIVAFGTGYGSAFGLVRGLPPRLGMLLPAWLAGTVWLEYTLLEHINNPLAAIEDRTIYAGILAGILLVLLVLFVRGSSQLHTALTAHQPSKPLRTSLPPRAWFAAKLLRRPATRLSFGVTFAISLAVAVAAQRQGVAQPDALGFIGAMLAASFATDIRATVRRYNPAEITGLRGTGRFVATQLTHTVSGCLAAIAPIIATLATLPYQWSAGDSIYYALQIGIGIAAGAFAGSLLVPEGRDISGQFTATVIVLIILVAMPQVVAIDSFGTTTRALLNGLVCSALVIGIVGIEQQRNPYVWRRQHAAP